MTPEQPYIFSPAEWDRHLSATNAPIELMGQYTNLETETVARRYLGAAVATRMPQIISAALARIERAYPRDTFGVQLLALGQLGQPEAIQATASGCPLGITPDELEDSCDQALARGISARDLRLFDIAQGQLSVALFLARSLGMQHREQHVMLELAQVLTNQGKPAPEMIEAALAMPIPTSDRRREYGTEALAEACMALGDYRRARALVARTDGPQAGLWAFTSAMLGERYTEDIDSGDFYSELASTVWGIRDGNAVSPPNVWPHSPKAEYAGLLRVISMVQNRSMLRQARRALMALSPLTPHQKVWQLAGLIHVGAMGTGEEHVLQYMQKFAVALDSLRTREYVLPLMRALLPETYLLLALLPHAHSDIEDTLPEIPILTGTSLTHRYQVNKLPGRKKGAAVAVWSEATGQLLKGHREARGRVRETLEELGYTPETPVINLGVALRAISVFSKAAPQHQRQIWDEALMRALEWVDSDDLREELRGALYTRVKSLDLQNLGESLP